MHTVKLTGGPTGARGRNGWFQPVVAEVYRREAGDIVVSVMSKRATWPPPIYLELPDRDAAGLAAALLQDLTTDLRATVQAEDARLAALLAGRDWLPLADADAAVKLQTQTEKRLAAWARQVLNLPLAIPAETAATTPIEVEWHPDYRGGDWADMGELTVIAVPCRTPRLGVTDAAVNAAFEQQVGQPAACIIRWVEAEEVAL